MGQTHGVSVHRRYPCRYPCRYPRRYPHHYLAVDDDIFLSSDEEYFGLTENLAAPTQLTQNLLQTN